MNSRPSARDPAVRPPPLSRTRSPVPQAIRVTLLVAIVVLFGAPIFAHELVLCDNTTCTGCLKKYSRTSIQINLADLSLVPWDNCPGVMIGPTLRQIRKETPYWSAELYSEVGFQGMVTAIGEDPGSWPITISPFAPVASLALIGPAARLCSDTACTVWTDLPDLGEDPAHADTGGALTQYPGRVVRANLAAGPGCPSLCEWRFYHAVGAEGIVDLPSVGWHSPMDNAASLVMVRNALFQLNYCQGPDFTSCYGTGQYRSGPLSVALTGAWDNSISSFDLVHRPPPGLAANWPLTSLCGSSFGTSQPGGPASCVAHADCTPPYSCTTSGCKLAACFESITPSLTANPRVFYREHISKNLIGVDFTADYRDYWSSTVATSVRAAAEVAWNFVRVEGPYTIDPTPPNAPQGHEYTNQPPEDPVYLFTDIFEAYSAVDGIGWPYHLNILRSGFALPTRYNYPTQTMLHEYYHRTVGHHYVNYDGTDMTGVGVGEGLAEHFCMSALNTVAGGESLVYDFFLQDWPYQEYCRPDPWNHPAGCYGMLYSGLNEYSSYLINNDSALTVAYLGSQFMTPVSGTAINPDNYTYFDPAVPDVVRAKPLRYHQFYRQVADDLYLNRNTDVTSQRKAWITRMQGQALAGAQPYGTDWLRCKQDDPSECALGAGAAAFETSESFDDAFRRWAKTHVEYHPPYARSDMHAKFELGGKQGIRTSAGNDQTAFISLPFDLGPTATPFTIIVTAETRAYSEYLPWRDSLRVYIDSDVPANRPADGRRYDDEYTDGMQCYAFGHDYAGSPGCKFLVGGQWFGDGNADDQRATMRFIPSTAFDNFDGAGGSGPHTLYIAAFNGPIVYSVEVALGIVEPYASSENLRGDYCANDAPLPKGGDPAEVFCELNDPLDLVSLDAGLTTGDKIIQVVAAATSDWLNMDGTTQAGWHEGVQLGVQLAIYDPAVDSATKWFALHGWGMMGKPFLLRAEKNIFAGRDFLVKSHGRPYYHHAYTWQRPPAGSLAARFYPAIRGLQMNGYMFDPASDDFQLTVSTMTAGGTNVNFYVFCEEPGPTWTFLGQGVVPSGGSVTWTEMPCGRVYALVGMAAPENEGPPLPGDPAWLGIGQVLDVLLYGGM